MPRSRLMRLFTSAVVAAVVGWVAAGVAHASAGAATLAGVKRASGGWRPPVTGDVARPFAYVRRAPFARGAHRGVDLAARPGAAVRAACAGVVAHAGGSPGGRVVTLRCGGWRVAALPLASISVRQGARVRAGARLGTLAAGSAHAGGLHLGVRRAGDPFGYVDPAPLITATPIAPAPPATAPLRRPTDLGPTPPAGATASAPGAAAHVAPASALASAPAPAPGAAAPAPAPGAAAHPAPAPEPGAAADPAPDATRGPPAAVWGGVALLALGAAGSRSVTLRRRRRRERHDVPSPLGVS